ncbi:hypothetical protein [Pelagibacterium sp. H642]|uniref:hypothetical protein n=1 Tax=Pelagibacterium sp. H642 TaxID=1881069 RepID=UPI0028168CA1|nr:hypothetical protein [Pelagibacterium sp. H642]WMT92615.1 hypothetical protein NO934_19915 [Pelagibacterium sp. H642]
MPVFGVAVDPAPRRDARPTVLLIGPDLKQEAQANALLSLHASLTYRIVVLTDGRSKQSWTERFGHEVSIFHYSELVPAAMASLADLALVFVPPTSSYRSQALLANLAVSGVPLVDCSPGWLHLDYAAPMLQGPPDLTAVAGFLAGEIMSSLDVIGRQASLSKFVSSLAGGEALEAIKRLDTESQLGCGAAQGPASTAGKKEPQNPSIVFVPTNGVGLGHAQRCSLIATELKKNGSRPVFAAFPSCLRMLRSYGFDTMPLVSRSTWHKHEYANDLVNYLRLNRVTAESQTLVFDGGYIFDSIYRSIVENGLNGVWIRRGLWQEGQSNGIALDREKAFRRVIVPTEAFEELNSSYSHGGHVHFVGPIVQTVPLTKRRRKSIRAELATRFGRDFKHLVVTMLGGGLAAGRSAQIAAICAMMAERTDTLHLVVVWPNATVEAGAYAWPNTRIVKTHHANALVLASDLFISAAGYNSYHEALYGRIPTIFMAQMSVFMDDQRRRAMAAVERGLADIVEPHEMHALRAKLADHLDGSRSQDVRGLLSELELPEPGTAQAARLIEEICNDH